jgi:drug/metabolite transporter (DMT)-like permease
MLGALLGLVSAAAFGANAIIARRGMSRVSSTYVATLTIFTGPFFFFAIAVAAGELTRLSEYPWEIYFLFVVAGICHFALGRNWAYRSIQLIGATRSNIVIGLNPIVTTLLAMIILKETITPLMAMGILCTLTGPVLILMKENRGGFNTLSAMDPYGKESGRSILYKGVLYGAGAAIFWGSSAIFIKLGLDKGGSPILGNLIAYLSASVAVGPSSFLKRKNREEILGGDRASLKLALYSGLTTNIGQLLRYLALGSGSAIVVSLMLRTVPVWVLIFALLFTPKEESFSGWVLLGNALLIIGTVLVLFS